MSVGQESGTKTRLRRLLPARVHAGYPGWMRHKLIAVCCPGLHVPSFGWWARNSALLFRRESHTQDPGSCREHDQTDCTQ